MKRVLVHKRSSLILELQLIKQFLCLFVNCYISYSRWITRPTTTCTTMYAWIKNVFLMATGYQFMLAVVGLLFTQLSKTNVINLASFCLLKLCEIIISNIACNVNLRMHGVHLILDLARGTFYQHTEGKPSSCLVLSCPQLFDNL